MARSARASERRKVLTAVREIRAYLNSVKLVWDVPTTLYDHSLPRLPGANIVIRERRQDEYPENSAQRWAQLARYARALEAKSADLADYAEEQGRQVTPDSTPDAASGGTA